MGTIPALKDYLIRVCLTIMVRVFYLRNSKEQATDYTW